jgi:hypothetical protein
VKSRGKRGKRQGNREKRGNWRGAEVIGEEQREVRE